MKHAFIKYQYTRLPGDTKETGKDKALSLFSELFKTGMIKKG